MSEEPLIICDNLVNIYKMADLEIVALQGLDLVVEEGELMALVGPSGSGKSTLMNILGGLDRPSAGRVMVDGRDLLKLSESRLNKYRREEVGFVSKTGSYRFIDGEWVKVSDKPPRLVDAYVPEGGYWDDNLCTAVESKYDNIPARHEPTFISSPEQKARLLKERGLVEDGDWTKPTKKKHLDLGGDKCL